MSERQENHYDTLLRQQTINTSPSLKTQKPKDLEKGMVELSPWKETLSPSTAEGEQGEQALKTTKPMSVTQSQHTEHLDSSTDCLDDLR